jgi:hypothetical protein
MFAENFRYGIAKGSIREVTLVSRRNRELCRRRQVNAHPEFWMGAQRILRASFISPNRKVHCLPPV